MSDCFYKQSSSNPNGDYKMHRLLVHKCHPWQQHARLSLLYVWIATLRDGRGLQQGAICCIWAFHTLHLVTQTTLLNTSILVSTKMACRCLHILARSVSSAASADRDSCSPTNIDGMHDGQGCANLARNIVDPWYAALSATDNCTHNCDLTKVHGLQEVQSFTDCA